MSTQDSYTIYNNLSRVTDSLSPEVAFNFVTEKNASVLSVDYKSKILMLQFDSEKNVNARITSKESEKKKSDIFYVMQIYVPSSKKKEEYSFFNENILKFISLKISYYQPDLTRDIYNLIISSHPGYEVNVYGGMLVENSENVENFYAKAQLNSDTGTFIILIPRIPDFDIHAYLTLIDNQFYNFSTELPSSKLIVPFNTQYQKMIPPHSGDSFQSYLRPDVNDTQLSPLIICKKFYDSKDRSKIVEKIRNSLELNRDSRYLNLVSGLMVKGNKSKSALFVYFIIPEIPSDPLNVQIMINQNPENMSLPGFYIALPKKLNEKSDLNLSEDKLVQNIMETFMSFICDNFGSDLSVINYRGSNLEQFSISSSVSINYENTPQDEIFAIPNPSSLKSHPGTINTASTMGLFFRNTENESKSSYKKIASTSVLLKQSFFNPLDVSVEDEPEEFEAKSEHSEDVEDEPEEFEAKSEHSEAENENKEVQADVQAENVKKSENKEVQAEDEESEDEESEDAEI
jgi:hypothetical protein